MTADKRPLVGIIRAHKDPRIPDNSADTGKCPNCAGETETGYGHAGGGYGAYTFCTSCGKVVTKTEAPEDDLIFTHTLPRLTWPQVFDNLAVCVAVVIVAAIAWAVTR